ncbi:3-oxosteroid 1-dehydrogenase [Lophiostoma macrostomum CBS 122681]|uniref:3-oxosteroid 1-dehydrogenase n=1 Tax=Lophiostoma macrostomum CBS 122681 TaxID=1314788 RepID=A0A6A6T437_9PLEO|nr:3-oxosteroid 1-dehydrogenase [Lophiostoma macrostomum CBS 122681]
MFISGRHPAATATVRFHRSFSSSRISNINRLHPDTLIVGSGAAALTAAFRAKSHNLNPLVIEKSPLIGGTTCYSGGGLWIPNSGVHPADSPDSFSEAMKYMQNTIDKHPTKSSSLARKYAFLENGPKMVDFLSQQGFQWQASVGYPDYYPLVEGGKTTGRSIEGRLFDLKKLGEWQSKIRMTPRKPLYPMYTFEAGHMYRHRVSIKGLMTAAKVAGWRMWSNKLLGRLPVTMGMSLVGQLLHLCIQRGISIETQCSLKELVITDGTVMGARVTHDGEEKIIEAKQGVILAAGGFARNRDMRKCVQGDLGANAKTLTSPEDQGDAITAAMDVGAATELMDEAWWGPTLVDSTGKPYWTQFERALPHSIIVDESGNRFVNEAEAYTRFIHNLFAHQKKTGRGVPAFMILDSNHRDRYVLSGMMPGNIAQWALDCGLYVKADTLEELAQKLDIEVKGLKSTVRQFNKMAAIGVDDEFERGRSPYDQFFGDPGYKANHNLGPIEKPPFHGAKLLPGDLGTKGGVLTDEFARAVKSDGSDIRGLYAVGNSSATVMGREYIGAGSTLGPALTFAYVAANHIAQKEERAK